MENTLQHGWKMAHYSRFHSVNDPSPKQSFPVPNN
jgi:hypothetical protein